MVVCPEKGCTVEVSSAFRDFSIDEGYLVLEPGQKVLVHYVGSAEKGDAGWLFGQLQGVDEQGWFPLQAVKLPQPNKAAAKPPPPPPPPAPPPPLAGSWLAAEPPAEPEKPEKPAAPEPAEPLPGEEPGRRVLDEALPPPGFDGEGFDAQAARRVEQGLQAGSDLPMHSECGELQRLVAENRVVVIDAATGSGKSTLVPLCLVQQCQQQNRRCRIVVTQPRKLAAKGLAQRVSEMTGAGVGDLIGYRVGGAKEDNNALVVYVTVGHLLEAMVHNPKYLERYSHVVLDEVHERFVEADLLMAFLRMVLSRPETMVQRILIMSATLQKTLSNFFKPALLPRPRNATAEIIELPGGSPYEVENFVLEDVFRMYPGIGGGKKERLLPDFSMTMPSRKRDFRERHWSDKLTALCRSLTPLAARLICHLYWEHAQRLAESAPREQFASSCVVLAFLPGLDPMNELETQLKKAYQELKHVLGLPEKEPTIILMHSALEEERYRKALDKPEENEWKVVLATNIAESSLTVPGVKTVIDFGLHRVNVYDDQAKMSQLLTNWCSQASLKQRRGRTGRTNAGKYISFVSQDLFQELQDFDKSGVERSPLSKVALQAAYLADQLSPESVRAGLPVQRKTHPRSEGRADVVQFFDGERGLWYISSETGSYWASDGELELLQLQVQNIISLLPAPPADTRVETALQDLQELGLVTLARNRPTVLGVACLQLPADVQIARLAALGWTLGLAAHGAILAAALSMTSCDVLSSPYNPRTELSSKDLEQLGWGVEARLEFDRGHLSEPLSVHHLICEWLQSDDGWLGKVPRGFSKWWIIHQRLWAQLTTKFVDFLLAMRRFVPRNSQQFTEIETLLASVNGSQLRGTERKIAVRDALQLDSPTLQDQLLALLTFAMAPTGFLAVGQSPGIYDLGDSYKDFKKAVAEQPYPVNEADALWWPKLPQHGVLSQQGVGEVMTAAKRQPPFGVVESGKESKVEGVSVFFNPNIESRLRMDQSTMHPDAQVLYRVCGPYNGKPTTIYLNNKDKLIVEPPQHPGSYNWYMPKRDGQGLLEVRVGWKSQAFSMIQPVPPGKKKLGKCRPKRFLVSSGAEYFSYHGKREYMFRGTSVLPDGGGGRKALLWLLAAGVPREAEMTALAAPTLDRNEYEVRGLWMWKRTFRLPDDALMSGSDLRAVNLFRQSLSELQRCKPHRLAGFWMEQPSGRCIEQRFYHIESLDPNSEPHRDPCPGASKLTELEEVLSVRRNATDRGSGRFHGFAGRSRWVLVGKNDEQDVWFDERADGKIIWSNGAVWERSIEDAESTPTFEAFSAQRVIAFQHAAEELLKVADSAGRRRAMRPARLVPLLATCAGGQRRAVMPFDLDRVDVLMEEYRSILAENPSAYSGEDFWSEDDEPMEDNDDEPFVDRSLEQIDEEFMWNLADREDFQPEKSLRLVENALAFPTSTVCCECDCEGKSFSKIQLRKPNGQRVCQDCIAKRQCASYLAASKGIHTKTGPMNTPVALAAANPVQQKKCSTCGTVVTAQNCSGAQLLKPAAKRKCTKCLVAGK